MKKKMFFKTQGSQYDPAYQAIIDEASLQGYTLPSSNQQDAQNQLVIDLKSFGIWDKLDELYIGLDDGSVEWNTINWKNPTDKMVVLSPANVNKVDNNGLRITMTSNPKLRSPYNYGDVFRQKNDDNASFGYNLYKTSGVNSGTRIIQIIDAGSFYLWPRHLAGSMRLYFHTSSYANITATGDYYNTLFNVFTRDATRENLFENTVYRSTAVKGFNALSGNPQVNFFNGANNSSTFLWMQILFMGQYLTQAEVIDFNTAWQAYKTAI